MDKKLSELWQAALGQLQLNMSSANFNTWIKTLELSALDIPAATLDAPNLMTKNYVERLFSDEIVACLQQVNPNIKKVVFRVQKPRPKNVKSEDNGLFEPIKQTSQPVKKDDVKDDNNKNNNLETTDQPNQNSLSSGYTFDSFIVGSSNRLAFSAAQLVVEKPGVAYNPLFLYGPAGVGKTHLMWAIRNEIVKLQPDYLCLYITSEKFTNEYVNAIRRGEEFTNKYRQVDVLFVDDMQFIAGKEKTQEEFFHTFNTLHQNSKQIVLCSDRPPKEIPTLEERLRSRFEWGMVADISPPDIETRIAILLNKAAVQNVVLEEAVAEYIASSV
ncbi:MAG TPA: chromosomal replication initiator protein DnaA, partial [Candidatus Saccharibacteria bacterium]|nr:chromosomal replication initiator protein DnaA [Candidatus Saccharibacteria bacterium]